MSIEFQDFAIWKSDTWIFWGMPKLNWDKMISHQAHNFLSSKYYNLILAKIINEHALYGLSQYIHIFNQKRKNVFY